MESGCFYFIMLLGQQATGTRLLKGANTMAYYDPNFPFGYTPYNQPKQQVSTYAFVNGLEGAKQYILQANQSMLLMDNAQPVCYLKEVNALGQVTLKCFKLVEVKESDLTIPVQSKIEYATKEDIKALNSRLDELFKKEK